MKTSIAKYAFVNALLTTLYVVLISSFLFYVPKILELNSEGKADSIFAPIIMLSLLVFSVSVVGLLIFGRPVMWYLDGNKKGALQLVIYTLTTLFIFTFGIFLIFLAQL